MLFQKNLKTRYNNKCPISGAYGSECDSVHIIQKFICVELNLPDLINDANNGLLLFTGFHRTFDRYRWTLDVYRSTFSSDGKFCFLPVLVPTKYRKYYINTFNNKVVKIRTESLPYFWVDYHIFLYLNYLAPTFNRQNLINEYISLFNSNEFKQLYENPQLLSQVLPSQQPHVILKHSLANNTFLVLNYHSPWDSKHWVKGESLSSELIDQYQHHLEYQDN